MTNEELRTKLYGKVSAEQKQFIDWLLTQPPGRGKDVNELLQPRLGLNRQKEVISL